MKLYLAMDPETRRITAQPFEFDEAGLPQGVRRIGWSFRELDGVDEDAWGKMLLGARHGGHSLKEQDRIHRQWWNDAGEDGDAPWPSL